MSQSGCCDPIIGGECYMTMNGKTYHAMGDFTLQPAAVEREAAATSSGEMVVTEKSKLVRMSCDFANMCVADPQDLYDARCYVDITIVEKSRGIRHLLSKAAIIGNPSVNLSTGVVTGLEVACKPANYLPTTN